MILACPFCKAKADPATSTCSSCAKKMTRACPACAETISATSTTCKYCGEAVTPAKEAKETAPARPDPGIVFIEQTPRRKCCAGRTMFWLMVGLLAAFCGYSAIKTRIHCHKQMPVKQQIQAPVRDL